MWLQWVEQLAFLQDQLLSSATHAVAVVLLHLVVQLLGCGLVLVRLFTNFAFTLLARYDHILLPPPPPSVDCLLSGDAAPFQCRASGGKFTRSTTNNK